MLFAVGADARWRDGGIRVNAVHPGPIAQTRLSRHIDPEQMARIRSELSFTCKTAEQGAATSVLAAISPLLNSVDGRYLAGCNEAPLLAPGTPDIAGAMRGVAWYAADPGAAVRLWELSLRAIANGGKRHGA